MLGFAGRDVSVTTKGVKNAVTVCADSLLQQCSLWNEVLPLWACVLRLRDRKPARLISFEIPDYPGCSGKIFLRLTETRDNSQKYQKKKTRK